MYTRTTTVINPAGLHARPAQKLVISAKKFQSDITICKTGTDKQANVKSIIALLSQGITQNTEITLSAEGADERQAVDTLLALIESGFGEE